MQTLQVVLLAHSLQLFPQTSQVSAAVVVDLVRKLPSIQTVHLPAAVHSAHPVTLFAPVAQSKQLKLSAAL